MTVAIRNKQKFEVSKQLGSVLLKSFSWRTHVFVFIVASVVVILRKPDAIFNPQFWAEDGAIWYSTAYNLGGIRSIALPVAGYFQTISRLVAAFAQIFPFSWSPLIFYLFAIIIKVLPINFLFSSRFHSLIPSPAARIFLAFIYLALPNSWEVHANITNAQWHLAILAFMVLIAPEGHNIAWYCFDVIVILLSGLSGPFPLLLTPVAAFRWLQVRSKWSFSLFLLIAFCTLVQTSCILLTAQAARSHMPLGATPLLFIKILTGQVFLSALIGQTGYTWVLLHFGWNDIVYRVVAFMGTIAVIYSLLKSPIELRLFIFFASLIFISALISPQASNTDPQWQALAFPGMGGRYWFIPMLAFVTILVWMLGGSRSRTSRTLATVAFTIMSIGIIADWRQPRFVDFHFKENALRFETSANGQETTIPLNPPGWSMTLVKH